MLIEACFFGTALADFPDNLKHKWTLELNTELLLNLDKVPRQFWEHIRYSVEIRPPLFQILLNLMSNFG
jgi:hypothetical protein